MIILTESYQTKLMMYLHNFVSSDLARYAAYPDTISFQAIVEGAASTTLLSALKVKIDTHSQKLY